MRSFGDRWMADEQIESIKQWEDKNSLDSTLSSNYGSCLVFFAGGRVILGWFDISVPKFFKDSHIASSS